MPRAFACLIVLALVVVPTFALADPELGDEAPAASQLYHCEKKTTKVEVSFKPETDLKELVSWAMGFTCKNFMFDPSYVQRGKKVNVVTPVEMTPDDAYQVFLVALSTMGYTVVPKGNVLRIVESATARAETVPIFSSGSPGGGEQVVRYVLRPSYAQPQTIATALGSMKSQAGDVQVVGSVLIVTDFASHVRGMMDVVKLIDVPGGTDGIYTIPIVHADATLLAKELETLLAAPGASSPASGPRDLAATATTAATPTKVLVDTRTNTLIVAASQAGYERARALAERLDIPVETESGGQMHMYQLKAAIAEEVAKTLNDAIGKTATPGAAVKPGAGVAASSAGALGDALALEGSARVIADKATNKLIVMSTGRDYLALRHVIEELDEPRREVYIEAVIVDVSLDDVSKLGLSEHGTVPTGLGGGGIEVAGVETGDLASTNVATLASATGLVGALLGNAVTSSASTLLGTSFPSYGVMFQALAQITNSTVISAPSILALDNEDAKYSVGKTIPYMKGTLPLSAANPTNGITTTDIEHEDLTLDLDIKPHISEGDDILLELKHSAKDEAGNDPVLGPSWLTRTIETRFVVHDQQTVMITGLTQLKDDLVQTKVPLLGDLPLIGHLFAYTSKEKVKSNLIILLTPYIIRNQLDLEQIRQRHQRQQDEFIGSLHALDSAVFQTHVDYGKKRGLLEEINRAIRTVDDEAAARTALDKPVTVIPGEVTTPAPIIKSP